MRINFTAVTVEKSSGNSILVEIRRTGRHKRQTLIHYKANALSSFVHRYNRKSHTGFILIPTDKCSFHP